MKSIKERRIKLLGVLRSYICFLNLYQCQQIVSHLLIHEGWYYIGSTPRSRSLGKILARCPLTSWYPPNSSHSNSQQKPMLPSYPGPLVDFLKPVHKALEQICAFLPTFVDILKLLFNFLSSIIFLNKDICKFCKRTYQIFNQYQVNAPFVGISPKFRPASTRISILSSYLLLILVVQVVTWSRGSEVLSYLTSSGILNFLSI